MKDKDLKEQFKQGDEEERKLLEEVKTIMIRPKAGKLVNVVLNIKSLDSNINDKKDEILKKLMPLMKEYKIMSFIFNVIE